MNRFIEDVIFNLPFELNGYEFQSLMGRGTFGCVVKAVNLEKGHSFAAKIMYCNPQQHKTQEIMRSEMKCLMSLLHPNIIKIYDRFSYENFVFLILELCNKGSFDRVIRENYKFSETQLLNIMKQMLTAVDYCHKQGIAHRDIKPANFMISDNGVVKLGDFGLGIQLENDEMLTDYSGSFVYKAPELLKKEEFCPFKADIWSLGVTFYQLATGYLPWGENRILIEKRILSGKYKFPNETPPSIVHIVQQMLVVDPTKRATAEQLLLDPYFNTIKLYPARKSLRDYGKRYSACFLPLNNKNKMKKGSSLITKSTLRLII